MVKVSLKKVKVSLKRSKYPGLEVDEESVNSTSGAIPGIIGTIFLRDNQSAIG